MRITIDGNIGSGKSTILEYLATLSQFKSVDIFPEPLDEWGDVLTRYLKDKKTWAVPLTLDILRGLSKSNYSTTQHQIVERSPYTCIHVFTEILKNDGYITSKHMSIIDEYVRIFGWKPDLIVYIDVPDSVCLDRIEKRGREGESSITYEYLRAISYKHEIMYKNILRDIQVIRCVQGENETLDAFHARIAIMILKSLNNNDKEHRLNNN